MHLLLALVVFGGLLWQLWLHGREIRFQRRRATASRTTDYPLQRLRFARVGLVIEALFVLLMLALGLEGLERLWLAAGLSGGWLDGALLLSVLLLQAAVQRAVTLLRIWRVERPFGYSCQSAGGFFRDTLIKGGLLLLCGAALAAVATHLLAAGWRAGWWGLALLWVVFVWARGMLWPALVAPLFNRYRPYPDAGLDYRMQAMALQAGVRVGPLLELNGSRRSSHGNAQVTGFGAARRVVLLDTLRGILEPEELLAVVAHEIGHLGARHLAVYQCCNLLAATLWIGLFSVLAGASFLASGSGLALLWLLSPTAALLVKPLFARLIRGFEHQADAFAETCGYGDALACALLKLTRHNGAAAESDPWFARVYHSHPRLAERLRRLRVAAERRAAKPFGHGLLGEY
ncbi:M48 family metalloprotease [Sedimenticola sp.]|uniref:M48 family metalloprotease n=1 Tax=Sedimenticola sp. TaxID=1940285 RepID=UPI002583BC54|nr:M48 family metalloprotease [Sedimenticola sp.]MCW8905196.1 M48 family metalloprotease [Sedimenticola sp.]